MMNIAVRQLHLSARGCHRVLKLSRTVVDLGSAKRVEAAHIAEALFGAARAAHATGAPFYRLSQNARRRWLKPGASSQNAACPAFATI
jgi:Magnesium chelatase, subunit ChlI C-terminal